MIRNPPSALVVALIRFCQTTFIRGEKRTDQIGTGTGMKCERGAGRSGAKKERIYALNRRKKKGIKRLEVNLLKESDRQERETVCSKASR